ncbi:coiled-coil domain-containing protein [Symbiopectobacterium purcellii]|uniref:coiled-coil domain-containing protein n=1 Tax=Symbiopectobacterium purcellii TaxID=2871826 RepID=UPI003F8458EC
MGQVAFDTQEFVETLENAGLPKDQAKAISLVVRKSHEVADLATKRDLEDVRKDLSADIAEVKREIADVRKDLSAEIADVRKDIDARFEKNEAQMQARFEKTEAQISLVRKDLQLEMAGIRSEQKLIRWMLSAGILGILSLVVKAFLVTAL